MARVGPQRHRGLGVGWGTVMNSFIAPNSAWNIVRIKYLCEPNFFDVVFVHVVCLWYHPLRILSPSTLLQNKN